MTAPVVRLPDEELVDWVCESVLRICDVAEEAGPDRPVPSCAGWAMADLVGHVAPWCPGWYSHNLTAAVEDFDVVAAVRSAPRMPKGFGERIAYARDGVGSFASRVRSADLDAEAWAFGVPGPARFWLLRAATEMAVHRWDAENSVGEPARVAVDRAVASVDEHHRAMYRMLRTVAAAVPGTTVPELPETPIGMIAADAGVVWTLERSGGDVAVGTGGNPAPTNVAGAAADMMLYMYGRMSAEVMTRTGDAALLDRWNLWGHDVHGTSPSSS